MTEWYPSCNTTASFHILSHSLLINHSSILYYLIQLIDKDVKDPQIRQNIQDVVLEEFLINVFRLYVVPPFSSFVSPCFSLSEHRASNKHNQQACSLLRPWPLSKFFPPFQLSPLHFFCSFFSAFLFFCTWMSNLNVKGIRPQYMFTLSTRSTCLFLILSVHRRKVARS